MERHEVIIEPLQTRVTVPAREPLLDALQAADVRIPADCGGEGLCGHCRVLVLKGEVAPADPKRWWSQQEGEHQWVLACQALAKSDLVIRLSPQALAGDLVALSAIAAGKEQLEQALGTCSRPLARRIPVKPSPPTTEDSLPDLQRLRRALQAEDPELPPVTASLPVLQWMPGVLRRSGFDVGVTLADRGPWREIIDIQPGDVTSPLLGIAVDVGTSTVVVQLVDLVHAGLRARAWGGNAQAQHGADVITRLIWAEEHDDGPARMQRLIAEQISRLTAQACEQVGCRREHVAAVSIAANAAMEAFVLGAEAGPIRRSPHVPVARGLPTFAAAELGIGVHPQAPVFIAPSVSGFVGGDISAGVLATGMAHNDELALLVDVGTNGEIVLGNRDWLMCCSCSAGPAFEGVDIEAGVHAVPGAIETIAYDADEDAFSWQTIGNRPPIGLCGTGLLEALAAMLRGGLIDRSGNLNVASDSRRVRHGEYEPEVVIAWPEERGGGGEMVLRHSEIENLLRSKAAVYAGIACLLEALALTSDMIERIYIAGAFGNRLTVEEAVTIGLLPDVPRDRITFAGNTALAGAYLALLCREAREEMAEIARKMTYLELSDAPRFMDEFMAALFLPHTELTRFPSQE